MLCNTNNTIFNNHSRYSTLTFLYPLRSPHCLPCFTCEVTVFNRKISPDGQVLFSLSNCLQKKSKSVHDMIKLIMEADTSISSFACLPFPFD